MYTMIILLLALFACGYLCYEFFRLVPTALDETEELRRCAWRGDPVALRELLKRGEITETQLPPHIRQE